MVFSTTKASAPRGPISIGLCGAAGRMGREIFRSAALSSDLYIAKAYEAPKHIALGTRIGDAVIEADVAVDFLQGCQVLVDFSAPAPAVLPHLERAAELRIAAVVGSTGFDSQDKDRLEQFAHDIPLLHSTNMSLGINLLFALVQKAHQVLSKRGVFDVDIIEMHHRGKRDAPSGTALTFEQQLRLVDPEVMVNHHSVRAGDVIGEHSIFFTGIGERLEFTHQVGSREAFARGVLEAVRFIVRQKPGIYDMRRMLGI
ncbi:MAG: 4-hydroxy-tetrahydrodipicolinate reductase [bacterium]